MKNTILDNDLYKFTMQQAVLELYPDAVVTYEFKSRRSTKINRDFINGLRHSIDALSYVRLQTSDRFQLHEACPFLKPSYLGYLADYHYDLNQVKITPGNFLHGDFTLTIEGPWHSTILWEVPLLAAISENYFLYVDKKWNDDGQEDKIQNKGHLLSNANAIFADFGTRRRRNYDSQERVVRNLKNYKGFVGSSNVEMALNYGVKPIGTMAHEWIMGVSALESLRYANRFALNGWNQVYHGDLGIALTDTFGTDAFFEDFDNVLARLFDGVRHDSGDPFDFARKVVAFYKKIRIDCSTKTIVFSDGLDAETAVKILELCNDLGIRCSFGIGTNFTNDYFGSAALNIVIKLRSVQKNAKSRPIQVVKLSDVPTKATGDYDALLIAKNVFYGEQLPLGPAFAG